MEGDKIALELLRQAPAQVETIYALAEWADARKDLIRQAGRPLEIISSADLERISSLQTPNQVYLLSSLEPPPPDPQRVGSDLSLFLDGIGDPGNLGTILRIADWFDLAAVFCAPSTVEWANPKVIQASMGAFFRVPLAYAEITELREKYPEVPFWGTSMEGQSVYEAPLTMPGILVVGSESHGVSEETGRQVDQWLGIPPHGRGGSESLNAAVATGICCAVIRGRNTGMGPVID